MKFNKPNIQLKALLLLSLVFMAFVPIGTITHEYGHMAVAEMYGLDAQLHYAYATHEESELNKKVLELVVENEEAIIAEEDFPDKVKLEALKKELAWESFWISAGGPLQTCLTGLIGLLILSFRKTRLRTQWTKLDWLAVFLSLFWLREVANLTLSVLDALWSGHGYFFGGDELHMSIYMDLHHGAFAIPLGIIGALIAVYVTFKVVPAKLRTTFILAGFSGGITGYIGWIYIIGPVMLP